MVRRRAAETWGGGMVSVDVLQSKARAHAVTHTLTGAVRTVPPILAARLPEPAWTDESEGGRVAEGQA